MKTVCWIEKNVYSGLRATAIWEYRSKLNSFQLYLFLLVCLPKGSEIIYDNFEMNLFKKTVED